MYFSEWNIVTLCSWTIYQKLTIQNGTQWTVFSCMYVIYFANRCIKYVYLYFLSLFSSYFLQPGVFKIEKELWMYKFSPNVKKIFYFKYVNKFKKLSEARELKVLLQWPLNCLSTWFFLVQYTVNFFIFNSQLYCVTLAF